MAIVPPTQDELYQLFRREFEALGFTHFAEGSRIGAIGKVLSTYLTDLWEGLVDVEQQTNPSTARGIYLDRIGEQFGVRRLPPQVASTVGKGATVKFTNNGATSMAIPVSTRIWNPDEPEIAFFTTQALSIAAGAEGFVDVVAGETGENHNIGAGVLTAHNAGMGQTSVTNIRPIGGGTFFESDDAYRFRISQALSARHGATEIAIRQALLALPGVRDAFIYPGVRGTGTLDVLVVPIDRFASPDLLAAAEVVVADVAAAGISWRVIPPRTRRVDVQIQLRLAGGASIDEVRPFVESSVRAYVDNLRVNDGNGGSDLVFAELSARAQQAHPDILDSLLSLRLDGVPLLNANVTTVAGDRLVSGSVAVQ